MKRASEVKQKVFFIIFKEVSVVKNCLRLESAPLNLSQMLFAISDNLSKTLQKESMSALGSPQLAELTVQTYQKM